MRNIVIYLPKDQKVPYGNPTLIPFGNPQIDSLVQDVWQRSKPLHPDKLAYKLRQGHTFYMHTQGMEFERLSTMANRVPFEMYFPGQGELWIFSARNVGNRRIRREGGKKRMGFETYFLLYVDVAGRLPLFGSTAVTMASMAYMGNQIPPRSRDLKELVETNKGRPEEEAELKFLGHAGDERYWKQPWYLSWLTAPFSPRRKAARASREIGFEKVMSYSDYTLMRAEPSTLDLEETPERQYHQFQIFPV